MFGLSRLVALMIVFFMGFGLAAGLFIGIPVALLTNYTLRDVDSHIINIPDEQFIQPPEDGVDILDLNAIELYEEYLELQSLGDALTLDELQKRYGLIFHEKLDTLLTEEARNMPMSTLLSMEGVHTILNGLYIGHIEGYVCLNPDGTDGTPESEGAYWFDQNNQRVIRGLEEKIANLSLDDFVDGRINVDYLLHEITIADIFGYELKDGKYYNDGKLVTGVLGEFAHCHIDSDEIQETINGVKFGAILGYTEEDGRWFDESGEKVTGAMGVFAGACIDTLDDTLDSALLGDLLGYTYNDEESSWYDSNGKKVSGVMSVVADSKIDTVGTTINETDLGVILGYSYDESENWWIDNSGNKVHSFMNAVSDESMGTLGTLFERITVGQIIPEEQRATGLMSIIPADTTIGNIGQAVNESVSNTPLQFFLNQELVDFDIPMNTDYLGNLTVAQFMDMKSAPLLSDGKNYMVTFKAVAEGEEGYEEFLKNKNYYSNVESDLVWVEDENGNFKVPAWRTKKLSASFAYIITLMAGSAAEESTEPVISLN